MTRVKPYRRKTPGKDRLSRQPAFSLIELLVVIAIIVLLVGILAPSLGRALETANKAKTVAAIQELSNGALQYKNDTQYFPGQKYPGQLAGNSGDYTGSQMLSACMFEGLSLDGLGGFTIAAGGVESDYIGYSTDKVLKTSGAATDKEVYALSDRWPRKEQALLYYPSRLGNDGSIAEAFDYDDNSAYGDGAGNSSNFQRFIWDERFDNNGTYDGTGDKAYNADTFLLIGAGINRTYFETSVNDDVTNFD
jgi:prepilin-type N-terminal cleavage/methylation domain-containing protein